MYSIGETFFFDIDDEEQELTIVGDMVIKGKEYLISEDNISSLYVFWYNDMEEIVEYIDDEEESKELISEWQDEYYGTIEEINLWEEDYDDGEKVEQEEELLYENDQYEDDVDDLNSYIEDLMEGD